MHRVVFSAFVFLDLFSSLIVQNNIAYWSVGVFAFMGMKSFVSGDRAVLNKLFHEIHPILAASVAFWPGGFDKSV